MCDLRAGDGLWVSTAAGDFAGLIFVSIITNLPEIVCASAENPDCFQKPAKNSLPATGFYTQSGTDCQLKHNNPHFYFSTIASPVFSAGLRDSSNPNWMESIESLQLSSATVIVEQSIETNRLTFDCIFAQHTLDGSSPEVDANCISP